MALLDWPPPGHLWIGRKSRQFLPSQRSTNAAQAFCRDLGTGPELRIANAAAQTRIVSVARIRLDSRKSARPFKGIFCADISEFESDHLSHAVVSVGACPSGLRARPLSQWLY